MFLAKIPENSFNLTVSFTEIGLFYKSSTEEILITRAVFKSAIFQKPSNSLTLSYSIKINRYYEEQPSCNKEYNEPIKTLQQ
ncbi:hypothetical protein P4H66_05175 [Paenibacillus dokdonensis]|uniref:Uncharacterized protein n=1 Tax=Paenibacillus dokdonensis TaxID=2567944 RepID=A0ABU6GJG1_9BACL|nr:hypothetical protein [Paenibacillus dokdonensis]MEC0239247.1 hypothetical protein [Paenibacillus dokdonensis]